MVQMQGAGNKASGIFRAEQEDRMDNLRVVAVLEGEALAALERIQGRLNDDNIDDIVSAAIVVYDMHQNAMVHRLEQLWTKENKERETRADMEEYSLSDLLNF